MRHRTFTTVLALFAASVIVEYAQPGLRYLKYLIPVVALLLAAITPAPAAPELAAATRSFTRLLWVTVAAIAISALVALYDQELTARFVAETFFVLAPLVAARVVFPYADPVRLERYVDLLFASVVAAYAISSGPAALAMLRDPAAMALALFTSISDAESGLSFVFGLFCLFYLVRGRRRASLLAFVFVVLSIKRIAIAGTLAAALAYLALGAIKLDVHRHRRAIAVALVAVNAGILALTYFLSQGTFDRAIREYTGLSTDWVTMGRAELYELIFAKLPITPLGHGLGSTTVLLERHGMTAINAHSDLLKYAVEVGPIVASAWLYTFYKLAARSLPTLVLAAYLNVLLVTDNVSIYVDVMFTFYVLFGVLAVVRSPATPPHRNRDQDERDRESHRESEPGELAPLGA
jgi:uncharacterized membrane protein